MDAATWAAWGTLFVTLLGILVAVLAVWWQMRKQWLMNSASMVTELADRFTSDEWRTYRKHCAAVIDAHRSGQRVNLQKDVPVLGFFENMAHLVRRGVLDKEMIWNKFGWYITRYYLALTSEENLIEQNRRTEGDNTLWEEFEWLNREMLRIYLKRGITLNDPKLTHSRIDELLQQEVHLTSFFEPLQKPNILLSVKE